MPIQAGQTIISDTEEFDHQAIDAIRSSLHHLHSGIDTFLQKDFVRLDPLENVENTGLPSWSTIYHATNNISTNLLATAKLITLHQTFLQQAHPHPNSTYPVDRTHMISELLRRQPGADAQGWLENTLALGQNVEAEGAEMTSAQWHELWEFADWKHNIMGKEVFEGAGLEEGGEEEDDDEEEDEEMGGEGATGEDKGKEKVVDNAGPLMPLEDILRYIHSGGVLPVGGPPNPMS